MMIPWSSSVTGGYDKCLSLEDILKKEPNMFASGGEKYEEVNDDSKVFA